MDRCEACQSRENLLQLSFAPMGCLTVLCAACQREFARDVGMSILRSAQGWIQERRAEMQRQRLLGTRSEQSLNQAFAAVMDRFSKAKDTVLYQNLLLLAPKEGKDADTAMQQAILAQLAGEEPVAELTDKEEELLRQVTQDHDFAAAIKTAILEHPLEEKEEEDVLDLDVPPKEEEGTDGESA